MKKSVTPRDAPVAIRFKDGLKEELKNESRLVERSVNWLVNHYLSKRKKITHKSI